MFKGSFLRAALGAAALAIIPLSSAYGAGDVHKPNEYDWSFAGPTGTYDRAQLQRGLQVYREVCSACHSLELVAFRNLMEPGGPELSEEAVRAIAAEYTIVDGPDMNGEMFERPGRLSDRFPPLYANSNEAVAIHGAYPPDFSLIAKARFAHRGFPTFLFDIVTQYAEGGPDYITSLLTGYSDDIPEHVEEVEGAHYNPYFMAGNWIKMGAPLFDDLVEYSDGSPQSVEQYARDVSAFLMWAAEPKLEERKRIGLQVMLFLAVFSIMLYLLKRKVWSRIPH